MRRLACILLLFATVLACKVTTTPRRPVFGSQATVFVYFQPFPADAERLKFRVESISALTADGVAQPLGLVLDQVSAKRLDRERLLASGSVPLGSYSGLSLKIASASLEGKEGKGALRVSEDDVQVNVPFTLAKKQAAVVSLRIHYRDSVATGYGFTPDFSAEVAGRAPPGVLGIATSCTENRLTLFDKVTGRVAGIIPVGRSPKGVAIDPLRLQAYVAVADEDVVEVVDLQQYRSTDRIQLFSGDGPTELALTADTRTLLVVNTGSDTLSIIDPGLLSETHRVSVGDMPASVTIDTQGQRAYVFNALSDSISVVDPRAGAVVATLTTDPEPFRGQLNRLGDRLFVIHRSSPHLTVIDTRSLSILERVYVGPGSSAIKSDAAADRIYLARLNALEVDLYDPFSLLPVDSIPIRDDVDYMTIDGDSNNLGLVLPRQNEIRLFRIVGRETVARIDVGEAPCWLSFFGER